jgi:hypothetical protein
MPGIQITGGYSIWFLWDGKMYRTHWIYIEVLCDIHGDFNDFIIQRYIIYLHATRNDPFMWFMCRDMYHHHGAYGEL